ncbi:helix-turn-helix domain-containing protein [Catellatospora sp. TT07R-123]|uniref:helix-turn-helix domain-containing protein n=1 Tax=Catellatospora sp. TT07R-123 TaxID=2733863 RepID=UPI001FD38F62|nr:XRE family transcriptional regulator [Catellatospora sp. TT07R-123]
MTETTVEQTRTADRGLRTPRPRQVPIDEINAAVALHVRALRTGRGWSLDELSGRSGVSKGMLVQVEAGRTNPSVGTLARIADAFGVAVARLLQPAADRTVHLSEFEDGPVLWRGGRGGTGRLLRGVTDPATVELWDWRFAPNERYDAEEQQPGAREMAHVLVGQIVVTIDGADHLVQAGQTLDFRGDRAHTYRNVQDGPARVVMLVAMPPGEYTHRRGPR